MNEGSPQVPNFKSLEQLRAELLKSFENKADSKVNVAEANQEEITRLDFTAEFEWEKLKRLREDNEGRRLLRNQIFAVTVIWMFLVLMIVFGNGKGYSHLSDAVLISLITTTTANVFGFFYVVVNYLFNKERST